MSSEKLGSGFHEAVTTIDDVMKCIIEKLIGMETFQNRIENALRILNAEYNQRAREIQYFAKQGNN